MSKAMIQSGLGVIGAAALTLGAAQFALGNDLTAPQQTASEDLSQNVNRSGKSDREPGIAQIVRPERTFSFNPAGLADTSVLVRIPSAAPAPVSEDSGNALPAPAPVKSGTKSAVACEPVVSVLTDIARRLPPGRCLT